MSTNDKNDATMIELSDADLEMTQGGLAVDATGGAVVGVAAGIGFALAGPIGAGLVGGVAFVAYVLNK